MLVVNPVTGYLGPMKQNPPDMKVRLSALLRQQVEEAARANNRTLNAEIVSRLEHSFQEELEAPAKEMKYLQVARQSSLAEYKRRLADHERRIAALEARLTKDGG